jgi:hypothetical protein
MAILSEFVQVSAHRGKKLMVLAIRNASKTETFREPSWDRTIKLLERADHDFVHSSALWRAFTLGGQRAPRVSLTAAAG